MLYKMNFQKKLFLSLSMVIVLLVAILSTAFYRYSSVNTTETEYRTSEQIAEKMMTQIDELYHQMDIAATSIVNNEELQSIIGDLNYNSNIDSAALLVDESNIKKNLQVINFYLPKAIKTAIFNSPKNFYYYTGLYDDDSEQVTARLSDQTWYQNLIPSEKSIRMLPPHQNEWSRTPKPVLSLYRKFTNSTGSDFAIFEIQMPYSVMEDILKLDLLSNDSEIVLLDEEGKVAFPYLSNGKAEDDIQPEIILDAIHRGNSGTGKFKGQDGTSLYSFNRSDYTNFTVVLIKKQTLLKKQLLFYRNVSAIFGVVIVFTILLAFYWMISRLTKPLNALIATVKNVNLENMSLEVSHEGQNEFIRLNRAFNSMFSKLKDSINRVYESKIRETNAHILALQAQMNPHFLYNTLNVISASSEEQGNLTTAKMCNQLSAMLRYISSSSNSIVTLEEELKHVTNFLELMKMHYEDYLNYSIDIPQEMYRIQLPKITLQPFIENVINHGFEKVQPPWNIKIVGQRLINGGWCIRIEDNGWGFEQAVLAEINTRLEEYAKHLAEGDFKENLSIGGMGILNTYARLSIYLKGNVIFQIANLLPNGSVVTLGYLGNGKGVESRE